MDNLTLYNVPDYQSLLESLCTFFESFLVSQKVSSVSRKNYRSDLRDFISWIVKTNLPAEPLSVFLKKLNKEHVEQYKQSLSLGHVPIATINRRLSTLRKFFAAAISYGIIYENPTTKVRNVVDDSPFDIPKILKKFQMSLVTEGASPITVKNYVRDVGEFLEWIA